MTKRAVLAVVAAAVYASAFVAVSAQATKSVNEGVYTEAQAKRGEAIYKEQCAACHGDNLEGSGPMPPLAGKDFLTNWQGKPVADVFEKTATSMPATAPGSLSPEQTADTIAYMLSISKYPAGAAELPAKADALKTISLDAPK
jgi:S-disulfanyl-L-cysteine oxidoreductase SoxD